MIPSQDQVDHLYRDALDPAPGAGTRPRPRTARRTASGARPLAKRDRQRRQDRDREPDRAAVSSSSSRRVSTGSPAVPDAAANTIGSGADEQRPPVHLDDTRVPGRRCVRPPGIEPRTSSSGASERASEPLHEEELAPCSSRPVPTATPQGPGDQQDQERREQEQSADQHASGSVREGSEIARGPGAVPGGRGRDPDRMTTKIPPAPPRRTVIVVFSGSVSGTPWRARNASSIARSVEHHLGGTLFRPARGPPRTPPSTSDADQQAVRPGHVGQRQRAR